MPDGRVIHRTFEGNPGDAPMSDEERVRRAQTLIEVWIADTRFMLDQIARMNESNPAGKFTGKIDLDAVGIAGHSFGGATAAQICRDDSRCRAGIYIDRRLYGREVQEGIEKPFLFLLSDHGDWSKATPPDSQILADIRSVATHSPTDKLMVTMLGAQHFSFGDQSLTQSQILRSMLVTLSGRGGLDPRTGLAMTCRYMREFFDVHLRGAPRDALYSGPLVAGVRLEASQ
jgi:predicted dienelactone hydrolase